MLTITFYIVAASPKSLFINVYLDAPSSMRSTSVKIPKFMSWGSSLFLGGLFLLFPGVFAWFCNSFRVFKYSCQKYAWKYKSALPFAFMDRSMKALFKMRTIWEVGWFKFNS